MNPLLATRKLSAPVFAGLAGLAGVVIFQFQGNSTRGYINTPSLFGWWFEQWGNPASELGHAWFVLVAACLVFVRNLRRLPCVPEAGTRTGAWLLGGALALHVLGFQLQQPRFSLLALFLFVYAVLRLSGRRDWAAASVFPLGYMLFAVPLDFLAAPAFWLRQGVAWLSVLLSHGLGWDVQRVGTQLASSHGNYHYEVAAACSGLRSLSALASLCLLIGYLYLGRPAARFGLVLLSIPYAFLGNLLRVLSIIAVSELWGRAAGARVHAWGGWLVYALVLSLAWASVPLLRRLFPEKDPCPTLVSSGEASGGSLRPLTPWRLVFSGLLLTSLLLWWLGGRVAPMRAGLPLDAAGLNPRELPAFPCGDWAGKRLEPGVFERQTLPADTGYAKKLYLPSGDMQRAVLVSLVLSGRDRSSLHRPDLCLAGQGWRILSSSSPSLVLGGRATRVSLLEVVRDDGQGRLSAPALVVYWYVGPGTTEPDAFGRLCADMWGRLQGRSDRWAYVLMQTEMPQGKSEALSRIQSLAGGLSEPLGFMPKY